MSSNWLWVEQDVAPGSDCCVEVATADVWSKSSPGEGISSHFNNSVAAVAHNDYSGEIPPYRGANLTA